MIITIKSVSEFQNIIATACGKLVIIDFYATWCGPCKNMEIHVQNLCNQYKERVIVMKVNIDKFEDICDYYKVRSVPTFAFIKDQKFVYSFSGADPKLLTKKVAALTKGYTHTRYA